MNNLRKIEIRRARKTHISRAGYVFYEDDTYWELDKNNKVFISSVISLLDEDIKKGYIATLAYFAINLSPGYTKLNNERILHMLRVTGATKITESMLINYRATLDSRTEWYLGTVRSFLKKWHDLGFAGVSDNVIELLCSWTLRGAIKGDVVKRLDPIQGPLSDIELQGFNEGVVQAYEKNALSITDLAIGLVISNTGRRPIQISHLKIKDVLLGKNQKGEPCYLVNIPRAKQRAAKFRELFKQFAITNELWVILNAQVAIVSESVRKVIKYELMEADLFELPLFPDLSAIKKVNSNNELRALLQSDRLHIKSAEVTETIKRCTKVANIYSERTGEPLNASSYRFRYTNGTRAAREGFGTMVIAELLDHTDNQNAGIYIENIPEHVAKLDQAVGHQLAPYAQAFTGVLVDSEKDALRGSDLK